MELTGSFLTTLRLAGERSLDGKLKSYMTPLVTLDDWPHEVFYFNNTYVLELVTKGFDGYEEATYTLPLDIGVQIED